MSKPEQITKIKTLDQFIAWTKTLPSQAYFFRGVSKASYKIEASACRRLPKKDRNNARFLKLTQDLIEKARLRGYGEKDGQQLSDLELLAELQHYGAATCLMDFSQNALVALWMACQQSTHPKQQENGKVVAIRSDDPSHLVEITHELLKEKDITYFLNPESKEANDSQSTETSARTATEKKLYQWQPKNQNHRVTAQSSIFIFGDVRIEAEHKCEIDKDSKGNILADLRKLSGISEEKMFPDFDGFARLNAHNRLTTTPTFQSHTDSAIEHHKRGELDLAINAYTHAIALNPKHANAYYNRGLAYATKKDYDHAIQDFDKVIKLNPKFAIAYGNRGLAYADKKEYTRAIKDFDQVIKLNPYDALAYSNRGNTYHHKKDYDHAIQDYNKAIELNPNYADAYNNRGNAYAAKKDHDRAIQDYNKAIQLNPTYAEAYNNRGNAYATKKDYDRAIQDYNRTLALSPDLAEAYYNRGIVYLTQQAWNNAKTDLITTKEKGEDIVASFQNEYQDIPTFQKKYGVTLPPDLAALLS